MDFAEEIIRLATAAFNMLKAFLELKEKSKSVTHGKRKKKRSRR